MVVQVVEGMVEVREILGEKGSLVEAKGSWWTGRNIRWGMVDGWDEWRHRSMLWNSNVIRNVNQSLWQCLLCSAAM